MPKPLYLDDSYLKEFDAEVVKVTDDKFIILDKTAFYPNSGGQPNDEGFMVKDNEKFKVVYVKKIGEDISHEVDKPGLKVGDSVHCVIDWYRRYKLMRYHTAAHLLSCVIYKETGALITGNQLNLDKGRIDFNLDNFDREQIRGFEEKTNELIKKGIPVEIKTLPREEAFNIPSLFKLKKLLPESIKDIRFTDFGFDQIACAGTHVKNTAEIKGIKITGAENKGKNNRRVYFAIEDKNI